MATTPALAAFLGANPNAVFQNSLSGMAPQRRRFWGPKFSDIYGQYMGQQAEQAGQGTMPSGDFSQFLKPYNWLQEYAGYTPYQRGFSPRTFVPAVRQLRY